MQVVSAQSLPTWMTASQPAAVEPAAGVARLSPTPQQTSATLTEDAAGASVRLVRQALAGDAASFGELIDRHERAALAVAYAATRDASLAADAVQEACLKAWHKRHALADPERFAGWLLHIVRRCALDQLRGRKSIQTLGAMEDTRPAAESGDDAAERLMRRETDERIRAALDELDDESRLAVTMRYYDGCAAKQIAEVLGCSPAAVDMRLKRARDKLRDCLSDLKHPTRLSVAPAAGAGMATPNA